MRNQHLRAFLLSQFFFVFNELACFCCSDCVCRVGSRSASLNSHVFIIFIMASRSCRSGDSTPLKYFLFFVPLLPYTFVSILLKMLFYEYLRFYLASTYFTIFSCISFPTFIILSNTYYHSCLSEIFKINVEKNVYNY